MRLQSRLFLEDVQSLCSSVMSAMCGFDCSLREHDNVCLRPLKPTSKDIVFVNHTRLCGIDSSTSGGGFTLWIYGACRINCRASLSTSHFSFPSVWGQTLSLSYYSVSLFRPAVTKLMCLQVVPSLCCPSSLISSCPPGAICFLFTPSSV